MKTKMRVLSFMMAIVLSLIIPASAEPNKVYAAESKYITVGEYANELVKALSIKPIDVPLISGNIDALMAAGIIKDGDFTDYSKNLTRGDAAMLISRADDYLNKTEVGEKLIQTIIEKRISDIAKIKDSKRVDVAKAYAKGYIKGYSNGTWSHDRTMKGTSKVTRAGALEMIKMLNNKNLRAKISPDGQLIRTTNLPKNAERFPYILASFPNAYYDRIFEYETIKRSIYDFDKKEMVENPYIRMVDYAWPVDMQKYLGDETYNMIVDKYLDIWAEKAKRRTELVFNVDYRTIGDEWVNNIFQVGSSYESYDFDQEAERERLYNYVKEMKANKTIVECGEVAVDNSSLFWYDGAYHIRVHVKYRIKSSVLTTEQSKKLYKDNSYVFNRILYDGIQFVYLPSIDIGKWKTGYYDVILGTNKKSNDEFNKGAGYLSIYY
jgi:hypothetical protein